MLFHSAGSLRCDCFKFITFKCSVNCLKPETKEAQEGFLWPFLMKNLFVVIFFFCFFFQLTIKAGTYRVVFYYCGLSFLSYSLGGLAHKDGRLMVSMPGNQRKAPASLLLCSFTAAIKHGWLLTVNH